MKITNILIPKESRKSNKQSLSSPITSPLSQQQQQLTPYHPSPPPRCKIGPSSTRLVQRISSLRCILHPTTTTTSPSSHNDNNTSSYRRRPHSKKKKPITTTIAISSRPLTITQSLSTSSSSFVYEVIDVSSKHYNSRYALKVIPQQSNNNKTTNNNDNDYYSIERRTQREIDVLKKIRHENVMTLLESDWSDDSDEFFESSSSSHNDATTCRFGRYAYLLSPLYDLNLTQYLCSTTTGGIITDINEIKMLLRGICHGVNAIHGVGWRHNKIKTDNVLLQLSTGGIMNVVICDLGGLTPLVTCDVVTVREMEFLNSWCECGGEGGCGCCCYLAPELRMVVPPVTVTGLADVYSIGGVLYRLMFGESAAVALMGWRRREEMGGEGVGMMIPPLPNVAGRFLLCLSLAMMLWDPMKRVRLDEVIRLLMSSDDDDDLSCFSDDVFRGIYDDYGPIEGVTTSTMTIDERSCITNMKTTSHINHPLITRETDSEDDDGNISLPQQQIIMNDSFDIDQKQPSFNATTSTTTTTTCQKMGECLIKRTCSKSTTTTDANSTATTTAAPYVFAHDNNNNSNNEHENENDDDTITWIEFQNDDSPANISTMSPLSLFDLSIDDGHNSLTPTTTTTNSLTNKNTTTNSNNNIVKSGPLRQKRRPSRRRRQQQTTSTTIWKTVHLYLTNDAMLILKKTPSSSSSKTTEKTLLRVNLAKSEFVNVSLLGKQLSRNDDDDGGGVGYIMVISYSDESRRGLIKNPTRRHCRQGGGEERGLRFMTENEIEAKEWADVIVTTWQCGRELYLGGGGEEI